MSRKIENAILLMRGYYTCLRYGISSGRRFLAHKGVFANRRKKGAIRIGDRVRLGHNVGIYIDSDEAKVIIGDNSFINNRSEIKSMLSVTIGDDCVVSWDVSIMDSDYHSFNGSPIRAAVTIGDHVWIGCKAVILKGVTIGEGAVIAAGAVVNRDVPAFSMVGGVPARVIKENVEWTR